MRINKNKTNGMTLIEVMVVVAIVGILTSIALPSYSEYVQKSRRLDAVDGLTILANKMERYYTRTNSYATATIAAGVPATDVLDSTSTTDGYYTLSIEPGSVGAPLTTATAYTIRATVNSTKSQANDSKCGNFELTSTGVRSVSGTKSADPDYCW